MSDSIERRRLDKFYTLPDIARECINRVTSINDYDLVIEPSAGNGSFYNNITHKNIVGIDISPDHKKIIQQDFFEYHPPIGSTKILVIGNPPFGRVSSLAIKFFNHAAKWADTIAFIIPKTFRKTSVQNRLNLSFHLIDDMDIREKPCAFEPTMGVKCCFQIWERRNSLRSVVDLPQIHPDWEFLQFGPKDVNNQPTPPTGADFAIRAYGGKCGFIQTKDLESLRPKSWHWVKSNIDVDELIHRFENLDYSNSLNTARQNSIGKKELTQLYTTSLNPRV